MLEALSSPLGKWYLKRLFFGLSTKKDFENVYEEDAAKNVVDLTNDAYPHATQDEEASSFPEEDWNEAEALEYESEAMNIDSLKSNE